MYNITQKINNKHTYSYKDNETQIFMFELILQKNDIEKKIRKLKKTRSGKLIDINDCILYKSVESIKITLIDINHPEKSHILEKKINNDLPFNIIQNEDIKIKISLQLLGLLNCEYQILYY